MKMEKTFQAPNEAAWRVWLEQHHESESEIWLVYPRAGSGLPGIGYEGSVEEALCFGWVDSLIQKIDETRYARKFTPRRPGSAWSDVNKRRVAKVIAGGLMTPAGLAKVDFPLDEPPPEGKKEWSIPGWIEAGLQASPQAWENFTRLPPTHKNRYVAWLSSAKREETRQRNLQKAIAMLERNERLEMNTRTGR